MNGLLTTVASNVKEMETNAEKIEVSQKSIQSCEQANMNFFVISDLEYKGDF